MSIPDSCKWSSKKRNRKTFEQQKKSGGETDDEDDDNTNDSLLSQVDSKKQQEDVQVVAKVNPHNSNLTQTQEDHNKTTTIINDYSSKKFKTTILTSATNLSELILESNELEY